jgi:hypothetical protein
MHWVWGDVARHDFLMLVGGARGRWARFYAAAGNVQQIGSLKAAVNEAFCCK